MYKTPVSNMGASTSLFLHNQCLIFGEQFRVKVIGGIKIIDKKVDKNNAEIIVKHYFCGSCANDGSCESEFSEETGIYRLINKNNQWKIVKWYDLEEFPCDGWMSVNEAIKMLEYSIRTPEYTYLKEESIKALKGFRNCKKKIKNMVGGR